MTKMVEMGSWLSEFIVCFIFILSFTSNSVIRAEDVLSKYEYLTSNGQSERIHFHDKRFRRNTNSVLSNHTTGDVTLANNTTVVVPELLPNQANSTISNITSNATKNNETIVSTAHKNLGENGAGQRKYIDNVKPINRTSTTDYTISEPIIAEEAPNPSGMYKEEFEENEDKLLADHNITSTKNDTHDYYNSTFLTHFPSFDDYWNSLLKSGEIKVNSILSQSHRRAATLRLSFDFPFYGQSIKNMTIATGGFLFTGDYVHSWLAATQYIAPLMANFDTSLSNDSQVKYIDNGTALTVFWENVRIQERKNNGSFTFAATLNNNGDIIFAYKNIPFDIETIKDEHHPVKVGLSDAYIIDRIVFLVRRKTIYEYHRVDLLKNKNSNENGNGIIGNSTVIQLTALPTCLQYETCQECTNHETVFNCSWCPRMNKCSNGNYRLRQEWNIRNCDKNRIQHESACPKEGVMIDESHNDPSTSYNTNKNDPIHDVIINQKDTFIPSRHAPSVGPAAVSAPGTSTLVARSAPLGGVMAALAAVVAAGACAAWLVYAYRNPHTRSGQMLIRYRPSQWGWRRGEARYTAATIHM